MITYSEMLAIRARADAASPGPWSYYDEGRDHWGGDSFISTRDLKNERGEDLYVSTRTAVSLAGETEESGYILDNWTENSDFIAAARTDVPRLCDSVDELWKLASDLVSFVEKYRLADYSSAHDAKIPDEFRALKERLGK